MRTTRLLGYFSASFTCFLLACSPGDVGDEQSDSLRSGLSSPDGTFEAELTLPAQWGDGYCASVTIKNTSASNTDPTTSWGVVIGLNGSTLSNAWNVRVTPSEGQFTAINEDYNGELKAGASTEWGFCGNGTGRPSLVSVNSAGGSSTSTSASSSSSSSTSASSGGGEGGATGTGGAGGEGGGTTTTTTTTVGAGGEGGGGTTTTTTAGVGGAGGEGGGTTTATTTTAGVGGAGGEGGGTTTATTTTAGVGGAGGGATTATTTTAGVGGAGGEGGGATTTAGVGGAGGECGGRSSDPACGPDTATFAAVQSILGTNCAGCHSGPAGAAGLDLRRDMAVAALVGQDAGSCSSEHALVVPCSPSSSYLMNKLNDTGLCDPDESSMPPGAPLSAANIKTINDWICAGAPAD
ncbi:cellulose binding domain-containing protein [Sorangium sp. So ce1151]|uniref:cellulose binding domain-containing protein n=1 Tax=Sorangium sp. So ce1151 TaxID=3133332 RepID=UPI003F61B73C